MLYQLQFGSQEYVIWVMELLLLPLLFYTYLFKDDSKTSSYNMY